VNSYLQRCRVGMADGERGMVAPSGQGVVGESRTKLITA